VDSTSGVAYKNDVVQDLSAGSPIQVPSGGRNAYTSSDTECLCCPDNLSQERQRPPTNATSQVLPTHFLKDIWIMASSGSVRVSLQVSYLAAFHTSIFSRWCWTLRTRAGDPARRSRTTAS